MIAAFFLLGCDITWSQIQTGSVVFFYFSKDEITIAADSRTTSLSAGVYNDLECKLSAFGNDFVFAATGISKGAGWDVHEIARSVFVAQSRLEPDPVKVMPRVAAAWGTKMADIYKARAIIQQVRKSGTEDGTIASAFFAATNHMGELSAYAENIGFDVGSFDSNGSIHVHSRGEPIRKDSHGSMGRDEVVNEFFNQTSTRAKDYMSRFSQQLPIAEGPRIEALSSKLIELSINLHPQRKELGFPIDILQLRQATGVDWKAIKSNCPKR